MCIALNLPLVIVGSTLTYFGYEIMDMTHLGETTRKLSTYLFMAISGVACFNSTTLKVERKK